MRPQVRIVEGRMFRPGTSEIIAGRNVSRGFTGAGLGESLRFAQRDWTVVGVFDAGGSAFDSEVWGDAEQLMQGFRRQSFSSVIFQLADPSRFATVKGDLEADPRLTVEAKPEKQFYAEQSESLAKLHRLPRHHAVGHLLDRRDRRRDDHDVRERRGAHRRDRHAARARLSARRRSSSRSSSSRSCMGLVGGIVGLAAASAMQAVSLSTINFQTFSELTFKFRISAAIVVEVVAFSLFMGFVGGFLPAWRAARMKIVDALRAA